MMKIKDYLFNKSGRTLGFQKANLNYKITYNSVNINTLNLARTRG